MLCDMCINYGVDIEGFCDNDVNKQKESYRGLKCYPVDVLDKPRDVVIISIDDYRSAYCQLKELGIGNILNFHFT